MCMKRNLLYAQLPKVFASSASFFDPIFFVVFAKTEAASPGGLFWGGRAEIAHHHHHKGNMMQNLHAKKIGSPDKLE